MFDIVYCISLKKRPDRLQDFFNELPKPWILSNKIEVFEAIDGNKCKFPSSWRSGAGAWGCYQSHLQILKKCLDDDKINNVLIFEDDAVFIDQFNTEIIRVMDSLPKDWQMLYLGGQHLKKPKNIVINNCLSIGTNINRTHAYAINTKPAIKLIVDWLEDLRVWKRAHHIDHHYGRLQENGTILPYCPLKWIVGQRGTKSDINGKNHTTRWWG